MPLHAPLALHESALVEDQVSVELCPGVTTAGFTAIFTVGSGDIGGDDPPPPQPTVTDIKITPADTTDQTATPWCEAAK